MSRQIHQYHDGRLISSDDKYELDGTLIALNWALCDCTDVSHDEELQAKLDKIEAIDGNGYCNLTDHAFTEQELSDTLKALDNPENTDVGRELALLHSIEGKLAQLGFAVSVEYPGFLQVKFQHAEFAFGFANGCFGWNLTGEGLMDGEADELAGSDFQSDANELAQWAVFTLWSQSH